MPVTQRWWSNDFDVIEYLRKFKNLQKLTLMDFNQTNNFEISLSKFEKLKSLAVDFQYDSI